MPDAGIDATALDDLFEILDVGDICVGYQSKCSLSSNAVKGQCLAATKRVMFSQDSLDQQGRVKLQDHHLDITRAERSSAPLSHLGHRQTTIVISFR